MKQILQEYGNAIIAAFAFVLIIAAAFTIPIMGASGLLAAVGTKATVTGETSPGLSSADAIQDVNRPVYEVDRTETKITAGVQAPLNTLFTSTDPDVVFSITRVMDEDRNDCLKAGDVVYDRRTHSVTFNQRGFYTISLRASGKQLRRTTFNVFVY